MPESSEKDSKPPRHQDVLGILAETIQDQGRAYGKLAGDIDDLRKDQAKLTGYVKKILKKLGIKDDNGNGDIEEIRARSWTENKLLLIFMILMALAVLVQAGVKVSELTGFAKAVHGIEDDSKEKK